MLDITEHFDVADVCNLHHGAVITVYMSCLVISR